MVLLINALVIVMQELKQLLNRGQVVPIEVNLFQFVELRSREQVISKRKELLQIHLLIILVDHQSPLLGSYVEQLGTEQEQIWFVLHFPGLLNQEGQVLLPLLEFVFGEEGE